MVNEDYVDTFVPVFPMPDPWADEFEAELQLPPSFSPELEAFLDWLADEPLDDQELVCDENEVGQPEV